MEKKNIENPAGNECGSAIALAAITLVMILFFLSFVVDVGIVTDAKDEQRQAAEKAALGALQAYYSSKATTGAMRLEEARVRAETMSGLNIGLQKKFLKNPSAPYLLGTNSSANLTSLNGRIIPGLWHTEDPGCATSTLPSPCPCDTSGKFSGPCFEDLTLSQINAGNTPNSMRVELKQQDNNPIRTIYAKLFGQYAIKTNSFATAVANKRLSLFAVNVSRSSHLDTHKAMTMSKAVNQYGLEGSNPWCQRFPVLQQWTEYAYRFSGPMPADCSMCQNFGFYNLPPPFPPNPPPCTFKGGLRNEQTNASWNSNVAMPILFAFFYRDRATEQCPVRLNRPTIYHYRDEFGCYSVNYTENGIAKSQDILIDSWCQTSATNCPTDYDGPEPLNSTLYGINLGLSALSEVDEGAILAFDANTSVDQRLLKFAPTNSPTFADMLLMTDVSSHSQASFDKRANALFWPLAPGQNIPGALLAAAKEIRNTPGQNLSKKSVILFTDGLANCTLNGNCDTSFTGFNTAFDQIMEIIDKEYLPLKIKLHVILIGNRAGPHTLLRKGFGPEGSFSCAKTEELSDYAKSAVSWCPDCIDPDNCTKCPEDPLNLAAMQALYDGAYTDPDASPFLPANRLFEAVQKTGGKWFPIRPPCDPSPSGVSQAQCISGLLENSLDAKCGALGAEGQILIDPSYTDSSGRLFCDPRCKSQRAQIKDAMEQIINEKPYVTVE